MRQLTSLDAQFLAVESARVYGHVGSMAIYDPSTAPGGRLEIADVCRMVDERIHQLPPFRWKLVEVPFGIDLPYWIDDPDFDLDFHIRESAVPPPGDEKQLAKTVARIFARPLDRNRPLWELYLIHGLKGGRVALLTKVHHSVVDGVAGNEILSVLLDLSPEGREIEPPDGPPRAERKPGELEMLARGVAGLPRQPLKALRSVPSALPHLVSLPGANAFPGVPTLARGMTKARALLGEPEDDGILEVTTARPPRTSFNGRISPHRSFAFGSVSLDTIKAIKNEAGVTVNDVVVALCAGAVREWMLANDELPDDPLVSLVPVSVRTEEQMGDYGNRISAMVVPIATDVADPKARLTRTHELLISAKERHGALPADLLTDATSFIPPTLLSRAAKATTEILARTRPPLNLVISNVPGPRMALFCAGARLEQLVPVSAVVDGVGLNMTVMSYRDHVDFGVVADKDQIDDVWPLIDDVKRALAELEKAVLPKPKPKPRRKRAPAKRRATAA
ncbi:MAG: WS/DGAT/MGAT family O-acyltransferase [Solirubrobacteraceae bacterium]